MQVEGSIRAVNLLIRDFIASRTNDEQLSRTAAFAKAKVAAKFEEPEDNACVKRKESAWSRWIAFDEALQIREILGPHWAKARLIVHEVLKDFHLGELTFTNGSSFIPLGDRLSLACKLEDNWTITHDCFDLFAGLTYRHRALRHATKKRFISYCTSRRLSLRRINRILWLRFKDLDKPAFQIFKFKLYCSVQFVQGNRFSTVPKNNLKDRPICLEPLCNMLVQRAVGLGIRACLRDKLGIDLDYLADVHRNRIGDSNVATIDLTDCSDAISMRLVKYLLPLRVFNKILASRSDMTLGPDDNFYVVNKVSSMGNGFTFDLMSLVLTALTRSFDPTSTVFGDDIICQNQVASDVVSNLHLAGFVVNLDKTYIGSDFRESCGSFFIDQIGYLTVFDLRWLKTPHDLIVACNKVAILADVYGGPFETLRVGIWSCVPKSLLGATVVRPTVHTGRPPSYDLDSFIRYGPIVHIDPPKKLLKSLRRSLAALHKPGRISVARAVVSRQLPASTSLSSRQWGMFFQNIHNGRVTRKVPRVVIKSTFVARVDGEQIGSVVALLPERE